jgi:hypothetical protein
MAVLNFLGASAQQHLAVVPLDIQDQEELVVGFQFLGMGASR